MREMGRLVLALAGGVLLFVPSLMGATCTGNCIKEIIGSRYEYQIAATATHCANVTMPCPTPGNAISYWWPATDFNQDNVPHDALDAFLGSIGDAIFTLPFSDPLVVQQNGWLYGPGDWHYAFDYLRRDGRTFPVRAAAPGTVIFAGWDPWSGNTVIVSHADASGVADSYRTIYMHLRNGPSNDCNLSWTTSVNAVGKTRERESYKAFLRGTGCTENERNWFVRRSPKAAYWGTSAQTLDANLIGRIVVRGEQIGWAGSTGPGGQRVGGPANTHLHIFFARKRASDGNWFFFDPYGIYGQPGCYPTAITETPQGYCVRLPVAWLNGHPDYADSGSSPSGGCTGGLPCPPGSSCSDNICKPVCICPPGCRSNENEECVGPQTYTEREDCARWFFGACVGQCFEDAAGDCKKEVVKVREVPCALQCPP